MKFAVALILQQHAIGKAETTFTSKLALLITQADSENAAVGESVRLAMHDHNGFSVASIAAKRIDAES